MRSRGKAACFVPTYATRRSSWRTREACASVRYVREVRVVANTGSHKCGAWHNVRPRVQLDIVRDHAGPVSYEHGTRAAAVSGSAKRPRLSSSLVGPAPFEGPAPFGTASSHLGLVTNATSIALMLPSFSISRVRNTSTVGRWAQHVAAALTRCLTEPDK